MVIVPFDAFLIDSAQASAAACIGCDGGTQCEKRISTGLSCASAPLPARLAASIAAASVMALWRALTCMAFPRIGPRT
jgi:hypothetical protein